MTRRPDIDGRPWPRLMRAATAAAYVDEPSVEAFRRKVGSDYPHPVRREGMQDRWLKDDLDAAIDRLAGRRSSSVLDAASVL